MEDILTTEVARRLGKGVLGCTPGWSDVNMFFIDLIMTGNLT